MTWLQALLTNSTVYGVDLLRSLFFIVLALSGVGFLIGFHELGHFIFCKLFRVKTPSFSIGFGPRIVEKKIGDTVFALSAIPLGGYVEIAGAAEVGQGDQTEAYRNDEYSFAQKPYYQKMLIMAGGILFNLIFAYVILTILFMLGIPKTTLLYPKNATTTIISVAPESAAAQAGLNPGDTITSINGQPVINNYSRLIEEITSHPNQKVLLEIERNGQKQTIEPTLGTRIDCNKTVGSLGIEKFDYKDYPARPFAEAVRESIDTTNYFIKNTVFAFKAMFVKRSTAGLGGPLMVISQTIKGAKTGLKIFLIFLAFISINLAVLNLLPLPILDGGQALFYTIEAIIRRPLSENLRLYIHYACWAGLLLLLVYLTIKDTIEIASCWFGK